MNQLKILHVIDSAGVFGAEVMLFNLVDEQIRSGLCPAIASIGTTQEGTKPFEREAVARGYKVKKFRMMPGPNIIGALDILSYARKEKYAIIHSHGYKGNILLGFMPSPIRKIPMIATVHGYTSTTGFSKMKIYEWGDRLSHRFLDAVVLVNKGMLRNKRLSHRQGLNLFIVNNGIKLREVKRTAVQTAVYDKNDITRRPNGTHRNSSDTNISPLNSNIVDFCNSGFIIGSIGRLSSEKGYRYLIDALSIMRRHGINAKLIIIGEGDERALLENLITKRDLSNVVLLPGYHDDAQKYMALFDVYGISSLTEGLPITLLEAMMNKVAVVASHVGGIPEVLAYGKAGKLVQPGNVEHLAQAITELYDNQEVAHAMVEIAFQKLSDDYSSENMAQQYTMIYQRVLK